MILNCKLSSVGIRHSVLMHGKLVKKYISRKVYIKVWKLKRAMACWGFHEAGSNNRGIITGLPSISPVRDRASRNSIAIKYRRYSGHSNVETVLKQRQAAPSNVESTLEYGCICLRQSWKCNVVSMSKFIFDST